MIVDAPLEFPENETYRILGDERLGERLVDILSVVRPRAEFAGFAADAGSFEDALPVVVSLESDDAKALFRTRRDDDGIVFFPLPVDEMWSYWALAEDFLDHLRLEGTGVTADKSDFEQLLIKRQRAEVDEESGSWKLKPVCYLKYFNEDVARDSEQISRVLELLSDNRSRAIYRMLVAGEPHEHWGHYLSRAFRSIQYFEHLDFTACRSVVNAGVLGGYEIPFLVCRLPFGAEVHNIDPLGHGPLTDYVRPWMEVGTHTFQEHSVALASDVGEIDLPFDSEGEVSQLLKMGMPEAPMMRFPCTTLDAWSEQQGIQQLDLIKCDLEGCDGSALVGATETIRRLRPQLALSIYHLPTDFWRMPLYVAEICPDYDFHLEVYSFERWETILYAVPKELSRND